MRVLFLLGALSPMLLAGCEPEPHASANITSINRDAVSVRVEYYRTQKEFLEILAKREAERGCGQYGRKPKLLSQTSGYGSQEYIFTCT